MAKERYLLKSLKWTNHKPKNPDGRDIYWRLGSGYTHNPAFVELFDEQKAKLIVEGTHHTDQMIPESELPLLRQKFFELKVKEIKHALSIVTEDMSSLQIAEAMSLFQSMKSLVYHGRFEFQKIMIEAAMCKISMNIENRFKGRFAIKVRYDLNMDSRTSVYDCSNSVIIGKKITRITSKKQKLVCIEASCTPEELQDKIIYFLKHQRFQSWHISFVYSEWTQGLYERDFVGLGALISKLL